MSEGRSGFDGYSREMAAFGFAPGELAEQIRKLRSRKKSDEGSTPSRSTYYCTFCDTYYEDQEDAIQCCVAVEAMKVILKNCGTCIKGACQCGETRNGGVER